MLDRPIACGKSGHSSALLDVNLTIEFLECINYEIVEFSAIQGDPEKTGQPT